MCVIVGGVAVLHPTVTRGRNTTFDLYLIGKIAPVALENYEYS